MTELWIALCVGLPIGLGVVAFALHERRAERASCNAPTLSPTGRVALVGTPSLDALEHNPQAADALRGRVRSIYVMSLPTFTAGAQAGNSVLNETGLFFIDIDGALHEPHGARTPQQLEALGRELAEDLGVPFDVR